MTKKFITRDGTIVSIVCRTTNGEMIEVDIESPESIKRHGFRHYHVDSRSGESACLPRPIPNANHLDIVGALPLDDESLSLHVNNKYVTLNGDIVLVLEKFNDIYRVRSTRFRGGIPTTYYVWEDGLCDKTGKRDGDIVAYHINNFAKEVEEVFIKANEMNIKEEEQAPMKPERKRHALKLKRIIEEKWYGPVFVNEDGDFYLDNNCKLDGFYQFSTETLDEIIHILTMIREFKENKDYEDV